jgi:hypothetical protein
MAKIVFIPEVTVDDHQTEYWNDRYVTGVVLHKYVSEIPEDALWIADGYYYDYTASIEKARTEWWLSDAQEIKEQVDIDFKRIRDYTNGHWHFVVVGMFAHVLEDNGMIGEQLDYACIGGITSDDKDAIREAKNNLIDDLSRSLETYGHEI